MSTYGVMWIRHVVMRLVSECTDNRLTDLDDYKRMQSGEVEQLLEKASAELGLDIRITEWNKTWTPDDIIQYVYRHQAQLRK